MLPVGTRIEAIDREVLERIYETGCRNILFAPESGSERMLEVMDKRVKLPKVLQALEDGREIGLHTSINIIVGHPAETRRDLLETYKFVTKAAWRGCFDVGVMTFCPYPGSADYAELVESGAHVVDEESCYLGLTRTSGKHSWNPRFPPTQLRIAQLLLIALFYGVQWLRRPWRIVSFIRSLLTGSEETYLEQMIRTRRKNLTSTPAADGRAPELPNRAPDIAAAPLAPNGVEATNGADGSTDDERRELVRDSRPT
ncbi:MAG: radical SAM protein [Actinomycetota bacterium]